MKRALSSVLCVGALLVGALQGPEDLEIAADAWNGPYPAAPFRALGPEVLAQPSDADARLPAEAQAWLAQQPSAMLSLALGL